MPGGTCEECGQQRPKLHRHHRVPRSLGGTDDPENIIRICSNCHENHHDADAGEHHALALAHTPEAEAKRSKSMRLRWADPEYRAMQAASRAWSYTDPEVAARRGAGVRRANAARTPERAAENARKISEAKVGRPLKRPGAWSLQYDACQGCGSTERKHVSRGYCTLCNTRLKRGVPLGPIQVLAPAKKRWAKFYDACIGCGTVEHPHAGRGLCESCRQQARSGHLDLDVVRAAHEQRVANGAQVVREYPKPPRPWSAKYDACQGCGEIERKHVGNGYCSRCAQRSGVRARLADSIDPALRAKRSQAISEGRSRAAEARQTPPEWLPMDERLQMIESEAIEGQGFPENLALSR